MGGGTSDGWAVGGGGGLKGSDDGAGGGDGICY